MADPRVEVYAELLVDRCIDPASGWQVLVAATTEARPLAQELSRRLARRGAYALPRISFGAAFPLDLDWIEAAPPELAATLAPLEQQVVDRVDASIFVLAPEDTRGTARLDQGAYRAFQTHVTALRARGRAGETPSVRCDFPCPAFADQAGLSLAEYEDVFYDACLRDWDEEAKRMRPVLERFDRADEVRIVGQDTDLTLRLRGRRGAIDDGHLNVPGGEVFYCPMEDSAQGEIAFDLPSGRAVEGVRLVFEAGGVVQATAERGEDQLEKALATDEGARRVGELGLGCNEGITRHLRNVLFDEKMAGTIHVALGAAIPLIGGRNESALHWDLVKDMRPGGRIYLDGELVQENGRWLF
jgi:aminopeptidase